MLVKPYQLTEGGPVALTGPFHQLGDIRFDPFAPHAVTKPLFLSRASGLFLAAAPRQTVRAVMVADACRPASDTTSASRSAEPAVRLITAVLTCAAWSG